MTEPVSATAAPRSGYLPDFCAPTAVFLLVLVSQLLALIVTLARLDPVLYFWLSLALNSLFIQWVTLFSAALLCMLGRRLHGWRTATLALLAFAVIQGVTVLFSLLVIHYAPRFEEPLLLAINAPRLFLLRNLGISLIAALLLLRYLSLQQRWREQLKAEADSQRQALQARIRPHFLFNSLNTIANLIRTRPTQAEDAVLDLADLFRASLRESGSSTLQDELDLVQRYLNLESLRLGERLRIDWRLAEDLPLQARMPMLILQPLVENAVLHGIQSLPEGGVLGIEIARQGQRLRCAIRNPKPAGDSVHHQGSGTAQDNVKRRLELAYGEHARMTVWQAEQEYGVGLTLPIQFDRPA